MSPQDLQTIDLDLGDDERFIDDADREDCGQVAAAWLLVSALQILKAGTPTHRQIADLLDFVGPFGAGLHCFNAWCILDHGHIDGDYEALAEWIRGECRRAIASGRVKDKGQMRVRRPKVAPGQADLFGGTL